MVIKGFFVRPPSLPMGHPRTTNNYQPSCSGAKLAWRPTTTQPTTTQPTTTQPATTQQTGNAQPQNLQSKTAVPDSVFTAKHPEE